MWENRNKLTRPAFVGEQNWSTEDRAMTKEKSNFGDELRKWLWVKDDPLFSSTPSSLRELLASLIPHATVPVSSTRQTAGWNGRQACCCLFINASENREASDVGCIQSGGRLWTMCSCVKRHKLACKSGALQIKLPFYPLVWRLSGSLAKQVDHIFFYASTEKKQGLPMFGCNLSHCDGRLNCARKKKECRCWEPSWQSSTTAPGQLKWSFCCQICSPAILQINAFIYLCIYLCIYLEVGKTF